MSESNCVDADLILIPNYFCRARITPEKETLLLTSLFALCLRVDDYATDTTLLSKDLSMAPSK